MVVVDSQVVVDPAPHAGAGVAVHELDTSSLSMFMCQSHALIVKNGLVRASAPFMPLFCHQYVWE